MRYITNVVSDEYGRIMRWEDLSSDDGNAVMIPDEAEETFDAYCGKKSKVVDGVVETDMALPDWESDLVKRSKQQITTTDIELALADIYEMLGGIING